MLIYKLNKNNNLNNNIMAFFFYFWSGNANKDNLIPEGNYNGIEINKTNLAVGEDGCHGMGSTDLALYKGKTYQKLNYRSFPRSDGSSRFTLGSSDSDALIIRYVGFDNKKEQIFKKQPNEHFVVEFTDNLAKIAIVKFVLETKYEKIESGSNPLVFKEE